MDSGVITVPRIGAQIYWMSRYLERGESLVRMLSATYLLSLDYKFHLSIEKHPLLYFLVEDRIFQSLDNKGTIDDESIQTFLVFHEDNPNSLHVSFRRMREDARLVREVLGENMWQTINDFYQWLNSAESREAYKNDRCYFYKNILDYCLLLKGIFYDSMLRDEYFHIMELGIMVERANQVTNIIDKLIRGWSKYSDQLLQDTEQKLNFYNLLLECGASRDCYFKKVHDFEPESLVKFFLHNELSPYSIQHCLKSIANNLSVVFATENATLSLVHQLAESLSEANVFSISAADIVDRTHQICLKLNELNAILNLKLEVK